MQTCGHCLHTKTVWYKAMYFSGKLYENQSVEILDLFQIHGFKDKSFEQRYILKVSNYIICGYCNLHRDSQKRMNRMFIFTISIGKGLKTKKYKCDLNLLIILN